MDFIQFSGWWFQKQKYCWLSVSLWQISVMIWPFTFFFIRMSKNGNSFKLCSIVNFILGCRFCSRLCNSLMSPHGHFQNMKQSSKYLFHDLVNLRSLGFGIFTYSDLCVSPAFFICLDL